MSTLFSCNQGNDRPAPPAPTTPIELSTPQDAARSVLACLLAQRAARAAHDEATVAACQQQLLSAAARDVILQRYRRMLPKPVEDPEGLLAAFVGDWGPIIGFYADGLDIEQLDAPAVTPDTEEVHVRVPARTSRGSAVVQLECVRCKDGQWRVAQIDFALPATSQPATRPAP